VAVGFVRRWLSATDKLWLLIFDDVDEFERIANFLPVFPTRGGRGSMLLTSRSSEWHEPVVVCAVDGMAPAEARQLLLATTGQDDSAAADELAEVLDYSPLALSQAAAYMNESKMALRTYSELLATHRGETDADAVEVETDDEPVERSGAVRITTAIAMSALAETRPDAARLLYLLAFFSPGSDIWLDDLSARSDGEADDLTELLGDPPARVEVLAALERLSLLSRTAGRGDPDDDGQVISVHGLTQEAIRHHLGAQCASWAEAATHAVEARFRLDPKNRHNGSVANRLAAHAEAVLDHASGPLAESEVAVRLWLQLGRNPRGALELEAAWAASDIALEICESWPGPKGLLTAAALMEQGYLLKLTPQTQDAQSCFEHALAIRQIALGEDHPETAEAMEALGSLLCEHDSCDAALSYLDRALAIRVRLQGREHLDVAGTLSCLGLALQRIGRPVAALCCHEQALFIREQASGAADLAIASTLSSLSMSMMISNHGEFEEILALIDRSLRVEEKCRGPEHPALIERYEFYGRILSDEYRFDEALKPLRRALAIAERTLDPGDVRLGTVLNALGEVLEQQEKYGMAHAYYERSVAILSIAGEEVDPRAA
ncbi:MAG: tetratricopeptide repeat protein, partial [Myxococcota bacterium]